jgi:pyruvate/2-oxoglutarate dehydrogenase complex dihydrolipoamide dehydrogenase (E3) component
MGGDCLNVGCVPSTGLIRSARAYAEVRDAATYGVEVPSGAKVNFPAVMERMRRLRAQISPNDSVQRFKELGVDVFLGEARFAGRHAVEVGGQTLRFARAVIATGARAAAPPIPGLEEAGYLTNETIFSLTELPKRFAVIGAGPIGCEMSQSFARFGSEVYLLEKTDRILPREDRDASRLVEEAFARDGVNLVKECGIRGIEKNSRGKVIHIGCPDGESDIEVDEILVGVGRAPNVEGLNLEGAGVDYDPRAGVRVNDHLQTSNRRIYAAGDVCFPYKFTHTAEATAAIVIRNALFLRTGKSSALTIPWCTYTEPEVAHVGMSEGEAAAKGLAVETFVHRFHDVDRAILDGEEDGFVKVHVRKGTDQVLGATIVAAHAGDMISEVTLAMAGKVGLGTLAYTIHPYPTQAEAIKKVGSAYYRSKLTPRVKRIMQTWLRWRR